MSAILGILAPAVAGAGQDLITVPREYDLYLSGKVVIDDGSPLPEPARMELICDARIQPQALTKPDGSFNFAVGGGKSREITGGMADRQAPSSGPKAAASQGFFDMSGCEVRAVLAGYRSSSVKLGRRSAFESPDVGTIVLSRTTGEAPAVDRHTVSASFVKAPEKARKAYDQGEQELLGAKPDPKKASKALEEAVKIDPQFAAAWNLLAESRLRLEDLTGARNALTKAIETDPEWATPCATLALLELKQGRVTEAAAAAGKAVQLVPDHAEANFYLGMAEANLGNLDKAEAALRVVVKGPEAKRFPRAFYLLGGVLAQKGQSQEALEMLQRYLELEPESKAAEAVRKQLEEWRAAGQIP